MRAAVLALVPVLVLGCASTPPTSPIPSSPPTSARPHASAIPAETAIATVASPTFDRAALSGRIVFSHDGDIWVMNADGTGRERLTDDPADDFDPAWSPDASQIAFRSHRDGSPEVYLMSADGSDETNLTNSPLSDYSPAWSPDGTRVAFASNRDPGSGGNDIYVIDVATGDVERLTQGGGIDEYPTWSPDGSRIAYACSHGTLPEGTADFELCVIDADGGEVIRLTDAEGLSDYPAWSPDGDLIAFQSTRGGWPTLPDYEPPAYEPGEFGEYDVYVVEPDGSNLRNVTTNGREHDQFPGWSPDGSHIAVTRYGCIVVVALDGGAEQQLSDDADCADGFADWTR